MKRILLLAAFFGIASASFAQLNKGQLLVGGNASFNYKENARLNYTDYLSKMTILQVAPNVGYFINDKLAAGARVSLTSNSGKSENGIYKSTINQVSLSPFLRYYFLPKTEKLNLFADAGYSYGRYKSTSRTKLPGTSETENTSTANSNGYYISAGPVIFVTPNTAVELTLTYDNNKYKGSNEGNKSFLVGVGFQIHL